MKKTLAAVTASILGVAGVLGASAAPASAESTATPLPKCTDATQHVVNPDVDPSTDAWYMTCIPQYGMGKAEFSISAPTGGFPSGYSLTDGHQSVVASTPNSDQVKSYFSAFYAEEHSDDPSYTGAFVNLTEDAANSTASSQVYQAFGQQTQTPMTVAFPITSVGLAGSAFPTAACSPNGETYQGEYVVNYAPVTTSFSELVGAKVYKTTVTLTSPTLYLGLNFNSDGEFGFDNSKPLCATSTNGTILASGLEDSTSSAKLLGSGALTPAVQARLKTADIPIGEEAFFTIGLDAATNDPINLNTLVPTTSAFDDPEPVVSGSSFAVTAVPSLAETGVDPAPAGILGGSLALIGLGAYVIGRRRRAVVRAL